MPQFEFHISRQARRRYDFDETLFGLDGHLLLADFDAARRFAASMTRERGQTVPASDINAMGLIDEILHILLRQHEMQNPGLMKQALEQAGESEATLLRFIEEFPPLKVYRGELAPHQYLLGETSNRSNRLSTLEELLLLHLHNLNPAFSIYRDLFDDSILRQDPAYPQLISRLQAYFSTQPGSGPGGESLFDLLTAPARVAPHSLAAQLQFLLQRWGGLLGQDFILKLLRGIDFVKEETLRGAFAGGFTGRAPVLSFGGREGTEYERFSPDRDWMPRLVLIARNTYVWLDQLSKNYQHSISRLDAIPEEELVLLQQRGITGLWLIGLWERSPASQRMKQMMGQADAVASAYSLLDYQIAPDLGGWEALQNLRGRAWQYGIRLSADMVPNHMGIDSRWVVEHPDWFLSLPHPPYPNYRYQSADLSSDPRVSIHLEDHYYDHSDAAVVFKRYDHQSGDTRYIYHGNDGTSMPWNDTAQLDFTKPDVRESVIQTILHVARNFPIIRFDAAMTLARKHIQRLWFPEPGTGGAIPSRAEYGLTRAQFEALMPQEFWREVVDRVAAEVPDTLLLAEAFWLMEGYFVRTLGMHRVYNSAFMHMMRDEDNAGYRQVMKNVLEFDPQVIKRFVNFMNNPDEKTAAEQFGDGDKYFGVCTLLATLPGLPMLGHGQIEGFREKYGMEFRRARWDENPNEGLVHGHEWKIFPLFHRRRIFAESEHFLLYDFKKTSGGVNEDVFAYSNRLGEERGLVIYHNKYASARGWVQTSCAFMDKGSGKLIQRSLAEGLDLPRTGYVIFRDYTSHLEYIRSCRELYEKGLYVELNAYQCHAFLDWRFVNDDNGHWDKVHHQLQGAPAVSVQEAYDQLFAQGPSAPPYMNIEKKTKNTKKRIPLEKSVPKTKKMSGKTAGENKKATSKGPRQIKTEVTSKGSTDASKPRKVRQKESG